MLWLRPCSHLARSLAEHAAPSLIQTTTTLVGKLGSLRSLQADTRPALIEEMVRLETPQGLRVASSADELDRVLPFSYEMGIHRQRSFESRRLNVRYMVRTGAGAVAMLVNAMHSAITRISRIVVYLHLVGALPGCVRILKLHNRTDYAASLYFAPALTCTSLSKFFLMCIPCYNFVHVGYAHESICM